MQPLSQALLYCKPETESNLIKELELLKNNSKELPYSISNLLDSQSDIAWSIYDYSFLDTLWNMVIRETSLDTYAILQWIRKLIDEILLF